MTAAEPPVQLLLRLLYNLLDRELLAVRLVEARDDGQQLSLAIRCLGPSSGKEVGIQFARDRIQRYGPKLFAQLGLLDK